MDISIIVPIYKGEKYINQIIKQVEACKKQLINESVELLLLNDDPEGYIQPLHSEWITIRVFNTEINLGIQGTRVKGYRYCSGEYVLFLDQDDKITDNYLKSQLNIIRQSNAAAVVCKAKENGREKYNTTYPFENVIDKWHMFTVENAIISPGQVLIRKKDISSVWGNNILKYNGADDWLLWLCMLVEDKKFVLNDDVLFEHVLYGGNASWNSEQMLLSEKEMYDVIEKTKKCEEKYLKGLEKLIESEQMRYIHFLEKYRTMFFLYDKWITLENTGKMLSDFLYDSGYKTVAVYGMGVIGNQLIHKLRNTRVNLEAVIDINADYIESDDIQVTTIEHFKQRVDLIIVSVIAMPPEQVKQIEKRTETEVVTLQQLLEWWENE